MDKNTMWQLVEILVNGLVTLVAAFAGAWYAFRLTDRERERQTTREQVAAVYRAQFVLIQQLNALKLIQGQTINPVREHPDRFIAMRPLLPVGGPSPRLDPDSLSFLLETDDRELPFRILVEQQRFDTAVQALNERSRLHLDVLQPRLAAAGIREGGEYLRTELVGALGDDLALPLQRATDDAIEHVDKTIESCSALVATVYQAMKARFPGHRFIRLDPNEPSNTPLQPPSGASAAR
jgi:hypothetical protein